MAKGIHLDQRLQLVAQEVRPGAIFADVGCDHGRLAVYLMQRQQAKKGFACDIRPQPLEKARQLIEKTGLAGQITPVLADGLQGLEEKEITDVTIAGIGGEVIGGIIEKAPFLQRGGVRLILQPMSRENVLRQTLYRLGFQIIREQAVCAGKFVYTVITAEYAGQAVEISQLFAYTGLLPGQKTKESREKLRRTAKAVEEVATGLLARSRSRGPEENTEEKAQAAKEGQDLLGLARQVEALAGEQPGGG